MRPVRPTLGGIALGFSRGTRAVPPLSLGPPGEAGAGSRGLRLVRTVRRKVLPDNGKRGRERLGAIAAFIGLAVEDPAGIIEPDEYLERRLQFFVHHASPGQAISVSA